MKPLFAMLPALMLVRAVLGEDSGLAPGVQATLDAQRKVIAEWASDPVIVAAARAQNARGPIDGMDNIKWKTLPPDNPTVVAFERNPAGEWLAAKVNASGGRVTEAFLNGAKGEKAAFVSKPTSYSHAARAKFKVPIKGKKIWQGKPAFDQSSETYSVQLAAPVLDGGKPIGVLVVGFSMKDFGAR